MTEKTPGTETLVGGGEEVPCRFPNCERPAAPGTEPLEVCREHWASMDAAARVDEWTLAHEVLKPWVETTKAIGFDRLTEAMERALVEMETATDLAREELKRADEAARQG